MGFMDPVAFSLGPLHVRWYGLMYVLGFLAAWLLGCWRAGRSPWADRGWTRDLVNDALTWSMFGVMLGGRLGYVFFYDPEILLRDPLEILRIWHGGMSFHGGLLGVVLALAWWGRRQGRTFLELMDFTAPLVPPGLFFGRLGNFINGELWGRPTLVSWGVRFPGGGPLPRHPSQLYEAALEGLLLFALLWMYSGSRHAQEREGRTAGLFALGYGLCRFLVEFVREPDAHLGFVALNWMTMGQILSLPLIALGLWLLSRPARVGK